MAKNKSELLKGLMGLPPKTEMIRPKLTETEMDESALETQRLVKLIHRTKSKEKPSRIALEISDESYDEVKMRVIELKKKFLITYIMELIEKDLQTSELIQQMRKAKSIT